MVSIFIASSVSSTSPRATFMPGARRDRADGAGHGRAHVLRIAGLDLARRRPLCHLAAIRHAQRARLAVELEEHRARAVLVRIAGGDVAHDQRLAALEIDVDLLARFHAVEEHRRWASVPTSP